MNSLPFYLQDMALWGLFLSILVTLGTNLFPMAPLTLVSVTMSLAFTAFTVFLIRKRRSPHDGGHDTDGGYIDGNGHKR